VYTGKCPMVHLKLSSSSKPVVNSPVMHNHECKLHAHQTRRTSLFLRDPGTVTVVGAG